MEIHQISHTFAQGKSYIEFLRTQHLSAGVYRLAKGAIDPQRPHGQEEIYYVISGAAQFRGEGRDSQVRAGDVVFVPAKEAHSFHNIEEDLELLVFFAPPEG